MVFLWFSIFIATADFTRVKAPTGTVIEQASGGASDKTSLKVLEAVLTLFHITLQGGTTQKGQSKVLVSLYIYIL